MINIVDLFCGCGGSAIGVERVPDTKILLAIDCWDKAVKTYNLNCRDKVAEVMDITKIDKKWLDNRLHGQRVIFFATQDKHMLDNLTYPTKVSTHYCIKDAIEDLPLDLNCKDYVLPSDCNDYINSLRKTTNVLTNHITVNNKPTTIERIKQVKPGHCMKDLDDSNPYKTKAIYNNSYLRQKYDDILVTQVSVCKSILIHPKADRIYTIREALRLQNFPDSFRFSDDIKIGDMYQMVANSIPPLLIEEVMRVDRNRLT